MYAKSASTISLPLQRSRRRPTEQGRDPYDGLRPWSAITHGVGAVLALAGTVLLLIKAALAGRGLGVICFAVYGAAMVTLYTASTLYHCVNSSRKGRIALRKWDHTSIYLLIAGSYTPVCLLGLKGGGWGWSLFGIVWGLGIAGAVLAFVWINAPRALTAALYLVLGWAALAAIVPLHAALSGVCFFWLLAGGLCYTLGGVLYALKWPGRDNPRFGCHEIFHLFVLAGSVCHWVMMWNL